MLVAERDERIVGTIAFYADVRHEGWSNLPAGWAGFRALAVPPRMRGAGIGQDLVRCCIERTRNVGAETLGIYTISLLTDAVRLYEQLGFVRCPEFDLQAADVFPSENSERNGRARLPPRRRTRTSRALRPCQSPASTARHTHLVADVADLLLLTVIGSD